MPLDEDWERYEVGPKTPVRERLHVTLNRDGKFLLNLNAYRLMGQPAAIRLYFNRKRQMIAIEPVGADVRGAYPVRRAGPSMLIYAGPFVRNYGIKLRSTERFLTPEFDADSILHLDLTATAKTGGWRRRPAAKAAVK